MLKIEVEARVIYTCCLNEDESSIVMKYAEENECELDEAVYICYMDRAINLYKNSTQSALSTEEILSVELT
jgi:hypothetical protein